MTQEIDNQSKSKKIGIIYAILAYVVWGLLPLFWKLLQQIPADQILAHRIFWSFIYVGLIMIIYGSWKKTKAVLSQPKQLFYVVLCAIIISVNWFTYIWAVNANHVVEASMGYYINPLVTVLLGVIVLKEKLTNWQWVALAIAGVGVAVLTIQYGRIPWVAFTLAFSFAFYGLFKKMLTVDSITGLFLETAVMAPIALGYLVFKGVNGVGAWGNLSMMLTIALVCSGVATATPLLWFTLAAKRVQLSTIGFLQYLAPTISLYLGVMVFNEEFTKTHLFTFGCIWLALIVYTLSHFHMANQQRRILERKA